MRSFAERCYEKLRLVPKGKIITYKMLAEMVGTRAVRAVGTAMKHNPYFPKVPCHRVVRSNGEIGQFALGPEKKIALLKSEGIPIKNSRVTDLERYLFRPSK